MGRKLGYALSALAVAGTTALLLYNHETGGRVYERVINGSLEYASTKEQLYVGGVIADAVALTGLVLGGAGIIGSKRRRESASLLPNRQRNYTGERFGGSGSFIPHR